MKLPLIAVTALLLAVPAFADTVATPAIIPAPQKMEQLDGVFKLTPQTRIVADSASGPTGEFLRVKLHTSTGYPLKIEENDPGSAPAQNTILLTTKDAKAALGAEGYELSVTPGAVVIRAPQQAGLFYGVQTFLQLLPPDIFSTNVVQDIAWSAPAVKIEDWPRFSWRGMMLDVSRHFYDKDFIESYLDQMAMHKLNVFHWHLTDDQGWRIEIKKYPKLTSVGAWRKQPGITNNNGVYGGFYTQDDIREVVAYAAARHITIVPEIEIPGHSQAALAAYPELSCSDDPGYVGYFYEFPSAPTSKFPPHSCNVFCASDPQTLEFFENVLTEVMDLFPGKYIHIGGDEVESNYWAECPRCQALMKQDGLQNYHQLQGWLTKQVEQFLNEHGRKLIGWDEILAGGLPPDATVMSWRGIAGGITAVKSGHAAIMAPNRFLYFNRAQATEPGQPPAPRRALITLETVYNYDPVPAGLTPEQGKLILGAEACLWTERLNRPEWLEEMTFPRLCALAEVDWSAKSSHDWEQFSKRLVTHLQRLDDLGVTYSKANLVEPRQQKLADVNSGEKNPVNVGE